MAPFLRDEGPPVSKQTIQRAREALPLEYGHEIVTENGREVLLVRVPKVKPDYLHDLAEVAFYVNLDTIRNTRDVLLIGHEKCARLEPQPLRDNIRAQQREDQGIVDDLRRGLDRQYGHTFVQSPSNYSHHALAIRIPKDSVTQFAPEDVKAIRDLVQNARARIDQCQYAYLVANRDYERVGHRILFELIGQEPMTPGAISGVLEEPPAPPAAAQAPPPPPVNQPPPPPVRVTSRVAFPRVGGPDAEPAPAAAPPAPPAPGAFAPATLPARPSPIPVASSAPEKAPDTNERSAPVLSARSRSDADTNERSAPVLSARSRSDADTNEPSAPVLSARSLRERAEPAIEEHEEYEIVSRPKAQAPAPAQAPVRAPAQAPAPAASAAAAEAELPDTPAHVERKVEVFHEEYEVYTSKPKAKRETPTITPPGQGGFRNAFNAATAPNAHKSKEYEVSGRANAMPPSMFQPQPQAAPAPQPAPPAYAPAPAPAAPAPVTRDDPRLMQPRTVLPVPSADSGAPVIPNVAPASPEKILAQRFRENGYEVIEGLRAQGTLFAFAAHRPNGRRVLVKRSGEFTTDEAAQLSQLITALGADVALVVADHVVPGARLATWGTRIEVVTAADVPALTL